MRIIAAVLIAVAAWCDSGTARAADLSGVWAIDRPAWEQQLDRLVQAMLSRLPPEMAAQMEAQGIDPAGALKESAAGGLDSTIEFLPGGVVRTTGVEDGASDDGRWILRARSCGSRSTTPTASRRWWGPWMATASRSARWSSATTRNWPSCVR